MTCKNCRYWNSPRRLGLEWGDCYRVVAWLNPELRKCTNEFGNKLTVPFDPNDAAYFKCDSRFIKEYNKVRNTTPKGVKIKKINGRIFFRTHSSFRCGEYKYEP